MSSYFSSIGFSPLGEDDFLTLLNRIKPLSTTVQTSHVAYWKRLSKCGEELWIQTDAEFIE